MITARAQSTVFVLKKRVTALETVDLLNRGNAFGGGMIFLGGHLDYISGTSLNISLVDSTGYVILVAGVRSADVIVPAVALHTGIIGPISAVCVDPVSDPIFDIYLVVKK